MEDFDEVSDFGFDQPVRWEPPELKKSPQALQPVPEEPAAAPAAGGGGDRDRSDPLEPVQARGRVFLLLVWHACPSCVALKSPAGTCVCDVSHFHAWAAGITMCGV